jgi:hypothetical protein
MLIGEGLTGPAFPESTSIQTNVYTGCSDSTIPFSLGKATLAYILWLESQRKVTTTITTGNAITTYLLSDRRYAKEGECATSDMAVVASVIALVTNDPIQSIYGPRKIRLPSVVRAVEDVSVLGQVG